jgi:exosortase N
MLSPDLTTLLAGALLVFTAWPGHPGSGVGWAGRWPNRLVALLLLSPGLRYISTLFTFPIRLQLSAWAGNLLRLAGMNVKTEGNVLVRTDSSGVPVDMAVDPACMGLQLTGVSLLLALFLLIWQEKQARKAVQLVWVAGYGVVTFGLTILCNLFRIVLLVAVEAMPGTWAHELIGLVCVAAYAWLPTWGLARWLVRYAGRATVAPAKRTGWSLSWGIGLLASGLGIMAFAAQPTTPTTNPSFLVLNWNRYGIPTDAIYRKTILANGFVQLTKPGVLIYLKPQPDWFSADHSPTACWRGSGYELRRVRETVLNGHASYVGELHKRGHVLHTAWWFTNGTTTTISQLTMRTQMLRGDTGFVLVNVTVSPKPLLNTVLN